MQNLMIKSGATYRRATVVEIAEAASANALAAFNKVRPELSTPTAAVRFLAQMYAGRNHETFAVMYVDNRHRLIECVELFRGTIDGATVHPREVVKETLYKGAAAVVFAHNHPSGVASPSQADELITRRLIEALALIDVRVLDHLIIAGGSHYSFAEHGLI